MSAQRKQLMHRAVVLHFMVQLSLAGDAEAKLKRRGMGRVHHRILYFAHFSPGITVSELLTVLDVRHQNIQRILRQLVEGGYVFARQSAEDGRVRQLSSSRKGEKLLQSLSVAQYARIGRAFNRVTSGDVKSYLKVMTAMLGIDRRQWVERLTM
jgi:DNA-binding MarR family transcriptional regulator